MIFKFFHKEAIYLTYERFLLRLSQDFTRHEQQIGNFVFDVSAYIEDDEFSAKYEKNNRKIVLYIVNAKQNELIKMVLDEYEYEVSKIDEIKNDLMKRGCGEFVITTVISSFYLINEYIQMERKNFTKEEIASHFSLGLGGNII